MRKRYTFFPYAFETGVPLKGKYFRGKDVHRKENMVNWLRLEHAGRDNDGPAYGWPG